MILGYKNRDCVLYKEEMATWHGKHNLVLTLDEGEADDRYQIGRVTDRLADMTLSDIDTMQAIVVGPPIMITFTVKMLLQKGSSRSKFGWTTNAGWPAPSGSAATAVWAKCMSAPTARYLTTPSRNVLPIKENIMSIDIDIIKARAKNEYRLSKVRGEAMISVRIPGGILPAHLLTVARDIAETRGNGQIHLTTRQKLAMPGIRYEDIDNVNAALEPFLREIEIELCDVGLRIPKRAISLLAGEILSPVRGTAFARKPTLTRPVCPVVLKNWSIPALIISKRSLLAARMIARRRQWPIWELLAWRKCASLPIAVSVAAPA